MFGRTGAKRYDNEKERDRKMKEEVMKRLEFGRAVGTEALKNMADEAVKGLNDRMEELIAAVERNRTEVIRDYLSSIVQFATFKLSQITETEAKRQTIESMTKMIEKLMN